MSLKTILHAEAQNCSGMVFYRMEGLWYACNHSAWFLSKTILNQEGLQVSLSDGLPLVCYVFTQEQLREVMSSFPCISEKKDVITCEVPVPLNFNEYYIWKNQVIEACRPRFPKVESRFDRDAILSEEKKLQQMSQRILSFDLEKSSAHMCLDFILELKALLTR